MSKLARRWPLLLLLLLALNGCNRPPAALPTPTLSLATSPPATPTVASTPTAAPSPVPTQPATLVPTPCPQQPAPRWADLYAEFGDQLGCATTAEISTAASQIPANGAFQYFERGTMIWRQHADIIYVLYDDGTFAAYPDDSPPNYRDSDFLKGGFGYLWNTNEDVRGLIGNPLTIEYGAADFALQDFAAGTILYFFDQTGNNYILLTDQGTWILRQA